MGFQSKHFPHESDGDESKFKKKEDHALVKYIKFQAEKKKDFYRIGSNSGITMALLHD